MVLHKKQIQLLQMKTLLATYRNHADADIAVEALHAAGISNSDIGVAALDPSKTEAATNISAPAGRTAGTAATDAASGAVAGGVLGTVGGLLVGVAALSIPGLGFLLAAGPIAAALGLTGVAATAATGAGIGLAAGGITSMVSSLIKAGVNETDANAIHSTLQSGGVAVTVQESLGVDVRAALQTGNPINLTTIG
jgi:hypothetical protein